MIVISGQPPDNIHMQNSKRGTLESLSMVLSKPHLRQRQCPGSHLNWENFSLCPPLVKKLQLIRPEDTRDGQVEVWEVGGRAEELVVLVG